MKRTGPLGRAMLAAVGFVGLCAAQAPPGITHTILMREAAHSHPGEEVVYVTEGSLEYAIAGQPPVTLLAGDVLFIPARAVHAVRNVGQSRGAERATYIVEKGQPLLVLAK